MEIKIVKIKIGRLKNNVNAEQYNLSCYIAGAPVPSEPTAVTATLS